MRFLVQSFPISSFSRQIGLLQNRHSTRHFKLSTISHLAASPMKDKTSVGQHPNKVFVTVEDRSAGFGSYELALISFGLIVALKALISILRSFVRQYIEPQHGYFTPSVEFIMYLGSHVVTMALSLFSFTVAVVHFQEMQTSDEKNEARKADGIQIFHK